METLMSTSASAQGGLQLPTQNLLSTALLLCGICLEAESESPPKRLQGKQLLPEATRQDPEICIYVSHKKNGFFLAGCLKF